jgi:hypothetical protein
MISFVMQKRFLAFRAITSRTTTSGTACFADVMPNTSRILWRLILSG